MEEKITVIVPVYNVEKYLERCVNSILGQTYWKLELILVDDGSTDRSGMLCDLLGAMDSRIKVIHKENGGLSDARNVGLDIATGSYICFVDSDDYIEQNMLETLFQKLEETRADMVICGYQRVDEQENSLGSACTHETEIWTEERFWEEMYGQYHIMCVVAWNKLYRKELFQGIRYKKGVTFEDEFIIDLLVEKCGRIGVVDDVLYRYRTRRDSIMANLTLRSEIDRIEFLETRAERLWRRGNLRLTEKTLLSNMLKLSEMSSKLPFGPDERTTEVEHLGELKRRTDRIITEVRGEHVSQWFRLNSGLFLWDTRIYGIWRKWYGQMKNFTRILDCSDKRAAIKNSRLFLSRTR